MYSLVVAIHIFVSLFLIIVVLLQTGKGASIGAVFGSGSSHTLFGSAGPTSFLAKLTAICAVIFMVTSIYLAYFTVPGRESTIVNTIERQIPKK